MSPRHATAAPRPAPGPLTPTVRARIGAAIEAGHLAEAESACLPLLDGPDCLDALALMAGLRSLEGRHDVALGLFTDLVQLLPTRPDIAYDYGSALRRAGRLAEAVAAWRRALALRPDLVPARHDLAMALDALGDQPGALAAFEDLRALSPEMDALARLKIGNLHYRAGDLEAAIEAYRGLVECHPQQVDGWINLGEAWRATQRPAEAEAAFRAALGADPGSDAAAFALGALLLSDGRWADGFALYERRRARFKRPPLLAGLPAWRGDEPPGTPVVLWHDQGFGDALQFVRFAPALAARGHRALLQVEPPLRRLLAAAPGIAGLIDRAGPAPEGAVEVALASLPHRLGLDSTDALWSGPYLDAPAARPPAAGPFRVGLVWSGATGSGRDAARSVPLAALAPLFEVPGLTWVSLQLGPAAAERAAAPWGGAIADGTAGLGDFADTATRIAGLDLLVSVDTAAAHLAGGLGRPVWVLLRDDPDWRWGRAGETTPWYPSARLFRQQVAGEWESPVRALAEALRTGRGALSPGR